MIPHRWRSWLLGAALAASIAGRGSVSEAAPPSDGAAPLDGQGSPCALTDVGAQRALARGLGDLSVRDETVLSVAERLYNDQGVPLSFIESDDDPEISFVLSRPTLQRVLEKIVELAPVYRYATIAGHLVLYPRSAKWDARLEGLLIGPGPRDRVASQLANEIERQLPAFAHFGTFLMGNRNSYVFLDPASVVGSGSVVELLVQLLGARPSAIFSIRKPPGFPWPMLHLGGVPYWQSLKPTAPAQVMHRGEKLQLKVMGILLDGTHRDVTARACGTVYLVTDEHVITVSPDGLVTASGTGKAWVQVSNADEISSLAIQVVQPGSSVTGGSAAPPPGARPRPQGEW